MTNKLVSKFNLDGFFITKLASRLFPLHKLLPFFDSFQGVFKENRRFFSGLYFAYRVLILRSWIVPQASINYLIATLQFTVYLLVHTLAWPYKQRIHNIIDTLLLANLAIISGLKVIMVNSYNYHYPIAIIRIVHGIEIVLAYIPMIVLAAYVSVKCFKALTKYFRKSSDNASDFFLLDNIRDKSSEDYYSMNSF